MRFWSLADFKRLNFLSVALLVPIAGAQGAMLSPETPSVRAAAKAAMIKHAALNSKDSPDVSLEPSPSHNDPATPAPAAATPAVPSKSGRSAAAKPAVAKPAGPSLLATIDLSSQRMSVSVGGRTLHTWKISSGTHGYETPAGKFRPAWSSKMWYSRKYNLAPMPYAVFFNGGIATHGTSATGRLGSPASHGCIRLRTNNAKTFYSLVHKHGYKRTRIVVTGKTVFPARNIARSRSRPDRQRGNTNRRWSNQPQYRAFSNAPPSRRYTYRYNGNGFSVYQQQPRRQPRRFVYPGDRPYRY